MCCLVSKTLVLLLQGGTVMGQRNKSRILEYFNEYRQMIDLGHSKEEALEIFSHLHPTSLSRLKKLIDVEENSQMIVLNHPATGDN